MKISSLYNVITDASDVLDYFEGVDSPEQLVSRLERLKRSDTREMMACIDGLRGSISEILDESLEVSTLLGELEGKDDVDSELNDSELDSLTSEETPPIPAATPEPTTAAEPAAPTAEKQNPAAATPPEDKKPEPS